LCGEWLLPNPGDGVPLCADCRCSLRPPDGDRCARCGTWLISEQGTCTRCRVADFLFESNLPLYPYAGNARLLLNALKFGSRSRLAPFFAQQAAQFLPPGDVPIVPVPSRPRRRSPDPVELVARGLAAASGSRVLHLLERTGGAQQKSLDLRQRRENLLGRIRLREPESPVPSRVLVLDDIFTTGATLDACARVLAAAGCTSIRCVTLAIEE
jgi:predicted amidophosphoribosyltransferase